MRLSKKKNTNFIFGNIRFDVLLLGDDRSRKAFRFRQTFVFLENFHFQLKSIKSYASDRIRNPAQKKDDLGMIKRFKNFTVVNNQSKLSIPNVHDSSGVSRFYLSYIFVLKAFREFEKFFFVTEREGKFKKGEEWHNISYENDLKKVLIESFAKAQLC